MAAEQPVPDQGATAAYDTFTITMVGPHGDTFTWVGVDLHTAEAARELLGRPNLAHIPGHGARRHGGSDL